MTCEVKRGVIGADGIHQTLSQGVPKRRLVFLVAQRRGHHEFRSFKIGQLRMRLIEQEILDQRLHPDLNAAQAPANRFLEGLLATEVNDIHWSRGHFSEAHEVIHTFGFHPRRAAVVMSFRSGSSAREKLFLRFRNESFVFAMRGSYNSELLRQFQCLIKFAVVNSEGPLVGQEDLERLDSGGDDLS